MGMNVWYNKEVEFSALPTECEISENMSFLLLMQISKEEFDGQAKKCLGNDNRKYAAIFLKLN